MKTDKYYWINRASEHYIARMTTLMGLDTSPQEILLNGDPRYLSYSVATMLSPDGHRCYDFIIEYDIYNPSQGIYFGCKSTTIPAYVHKIETVNALFDWQYVRPFVTMRLNNVFIDKDFTFRYKDTDNDTNNTFWPFWISLYEDESLMDVAVRVLKIIARVYQELKSGQLPDLKDEQFNKTDSMTVRTAFTLEAYDHFLYQISKYISEVSPHKQKKNNCARGRIFIEDFLTNGEIHGVFCRTTSYECAWKMDVCYNDVDFNAMIKALFSELQNQLGINGMKTPWNDVIRLFMPADERPYKIQIKTLTLKSDTADKMSTIVRHLTSNC